MTRKDEKEDDGENDGDDHKAKDDPEREIVKGMVRCRALFRPPPPLPIPRNVQTSMGAILLQKSNVFVKVEKTDEGDVKSQKLERRRMAWGSHWRS
eukprot:1436617-Pyramimonas_sp.AAC.2